MPHKLDTVHFQKLLKLNPADVCRRSLAHYDDRLKVYRMDVLGGRYEIDPEKCTAALAENPDSVVSVELSLLMVLFLLQAEEARLEGRWVSEFELKGGALFFRGPHAFRTDAIAEKYGNDPDGFRNKCELLGGTRLEMGDAAFQLQVLPRVPVAAVLWYGDEEFPASAKLLMDATIERHLPLDVIFGMALEVAGRITGERLWV